MGAKGIQGNQKGGEKMTYEEALDVLMNKIQIDVSLTEDFNRDYDCLTKCKEALEKRIPKRKRNQKQTAIMLIILAKLQDD